MIPKIAPKFQGMLRTLAALRPLYYSFIGLWRRNYALAACGGVFLVAHIANVWNNLNTKNPVIIAITEFLLARPMRFERTTYRVGVCHSIQLSYGRICTRFEIRQLHTYELVSQTPVKHSVMLAQCPKKINGNRL